MSEIQGENLQKDSEEKIYRFYERPNKRRVRTTVVGLYDEQKQTVNIAVARCTRHDQFTKTLGRKIAEGRLKNNKLHSSIVNLKEPLTHKQFINFASSVATSVTKRPYEIHGNVLPFAQEDQEPEPFVYELEIVEETPVINE